MKNPLNLDSILVVIPARGGSKRIRNKNIKEIFGQPMIYWPLFEIYKIFNGENVLVSTDSRHIKKIIESKGLTVPFMRPKNLSGDYALTADVVSHAIRWYEKKIKKVEFVLTVYPTAVLLREDDIISAISVLNSDKKCDSVMSATHFQFPIQRAIFKNKYGYAEMFEPDNYPKRSQDLPRAMHDAGQFYLTRARAARNETSIVNSRVKILPIHPKYVIDIDNEEDFEIAQEKLKLYKKKQLKKIGSFKFLTTF